MKLGWDRPATNAAKGSRESPAAGGTEGPGGGRGPAGRPRIFSRLRPRSQRLGPSRSIPPAPPGPRVPALDRTDAEGRGPSPACWTGWSADETSPHLRPSGPGSAPFGPHRAVFDRIGGRDIADRCHRMPPPRERKTPQPPVPIHPTSHRATPSAPYPLRLPPSIPGAQLTGRSGPTAADDGHKIVTAPRSDSEIRVSAERPRTGV